MDDGLSVNILSGRGHVRKIISFTPQAEPHDVPREERCSICYRVLRNRSIKEKRPSGPELSVEKWSYCKKCWEYILELRSKDQAGMERSYAGSCAATTSSIDRRARVG